MKKPDTERGDKRRKQLAVIADDGKRQRFLRGMITHDLVQRGLDFELAFSTANAVRDRLADRDEVTVEEIRVLVREHLEAETGELPPSMTATPRSVSEPTVLYHGERRPFSRGLLARSIYATGVDIDDAYRLIVRLEDEMFEEGIQELDSEDLAERVAAHVARFDGEAAARRYRLIRRLHNLRRPLVIYLGGASGTGKSTLALELAPLLRIYRINATDSIRQVMRMMFSSEMLPALHSSSFELPPSGPWPPDEMPGVGEAEYDERLLAHFEEQTARVQVGIRALVERAVAENMSVVIEGVHLYPPLVPFPELEGQAYQVPLMLTVPDVETHRARFLTRGRLGHRLAERYLESFGAIRAIHDFLLQQAETHDVPLLDTTYEESTSVSALRLLTSYLERPLGGLALLSQQEHSRPPALLLIIDGLPDRPVRALGGRTPLEAAATPCLDRLASEGRCGLTDPVAPGVVPDTAAGSLALLGQSPLAMKRGPVEALGAGFELEPGDVALRGNFATLDDGGQVVDRRAGRIREQAAELAEALDRLRISGGRVGEAEVRVRAATEHRLAIVLRGEGLSSAIVGSDPGETAVPGPLLPPRPEDPNDERAVRTAQLLSIFESEAREVLRHHAINTKRLSAGLPPANVLLTRGAGMVHRLIPFEENGTHLRLACIGADRTILGLAEWLGADVVTKNGMTANLDTDLTVKFKAAKKALERYDLVVVHVKGADIAAHDQRPDLKVEFIERVDRALGEMLERWSKPLRVAVASDHATLSESGQHAADPLPALIWGDGIEADGVTQYSETAVASGALQRFPLQLLLGRLFELPAQGPLGGIQGGERH